MTPREILAQLISIPSVNPMGGTVVPEIHGEHRLSDWLVEYLRGLDVPCERLEVLPGRDNVLARYDAGAGADLLLLDAHQDTVPVEGMTIAPFDPVVRDGRMYGRGSADVKGGLAAMLHAFTRLVRERPAGAPHVVLSCSCDEELTALGVERLVTYWQSAERPSSLLCDRPTAAIVAEPTEFDVVVAHRGVLRFRVRTHGRACHSSSPESGDNAIYKMARVVQYLEHVAGQWIRGADDVALDDGRRMNVGRIAGGTSVNIVPASCEIEIDRRLVAGEDPWDVWRELSASLSEIAEGVECEQPWIYSPALGRQDNADLAMEVLDVVGPVVGKRQAVEVPYCTHASTIAAAGVPSVVIGPGSIAQAHMRDEFIELSQLDSAAEIYYRLCASWNERANRTLARTG